MFTRQHCPNLDRSTREQIVMRIDFTAKYVTRTINARIFIFHARKLKTANTAQ